MDTKDCRREVNYLWLPKDVQNADPMKQIIPKMEELRTIGCNAVTVDIDGEPHITYDEKIRLEYMQAKEKP